MAGYYPEFCRICGAKMTAPEPTGRMEYNHRTGEVDMREMFVKCSRVHGLYGLWLYLTGDITSKHQFYYWHEMPHKGDE